MLRELTPIVRNDCAVEVDANAYSVPRRRIGARVADTVAAGEARVRRGAREAAVRRQAQGRRQRVVDRAHLEGVAGRDGAVRRPAMEALSGPHPSQPALLRPLAEYEAVAAGGF